MSCSKLVKTSIIIPTYRRPGALLQALQSLQTQVLPTFEIVVVDNADDEKVAWSVREFNESARVFVRYVSEPKIGLHNARHTGARAASGEILVFTDDDATFDPGWLQAYATAFAEHPEMVAAGGPVRPVWEVQPPGWLLDFIAQPGMAGCLSLMEPYQEFRIDHKGYFYGVNIAIRRNALFEVGGFNPEAFGDIWLGDGETGLNNKLWERGMLIGYVPSAIVYHHIPPERMTVEYLRRRMANQGACDAYTLFHRGLPHPLRLLKQAILIGVENSKLWIAALLLRGRTDVPSLGVQIHAARTRSQLRYIVRLIFDKDFQQLVMKQDWLGATF